MCVRLSGPRCARCEQVFVVAAKRSSKAAAWALEYARLCALFKRDAQRLQLGALFQDALYGRCLQVLAPPLAADSGSHQGGRTGKSCTRGCGSHDAACRGWVRCAGIWEGLQQNPRCGCAGPSQVCRPGASCSQPNALPKPSRHADIVLGLAGSPLAEVQQASVIASGQPQAGHTTTRSLSAQRRRLVTLCAEGLRPQHRWPLPLPLRQKQPAPPHHARCHCSGCMRGGGGRLI